MEGNRSLSLEETPTWSVASVITVMVFVCLFVERAIYRFGKWLKKTRRKALFSTLEKIKEELMLLGLISLLLGQCARWISQICVDSSVFSSKFYLCSKGDYETSGRVLLTTFPLSQNETLVPQGITYPTSHSCGEGREPFVSYEGLEQLHRFLFVLGITHVLYSFLAVGLAMSKIYSWRKWEFQAPYLNTNLQVPKNKVMRRQSTFALHHASHPWSRSRVLIWMLCFLKQFRSSIQKSDYLALRLGFINNHGLPYSYNFHKYMVRSMEDEFYGIVGINWLLWCYVIICIFINIHGLNIYFWLSFIPVIVSLPTPYLLYKLKDEWLMAPRGLSILILVMVVGTKQQHVVSLLALETTQEPISSSSIAGASVKPRDELFWLGKPDILLRLIQFISFQNAFEMASFIWSLWAFEHRCFMKNHAMITIRLISGVLVQFWCSYSTVPLNVIIIQMGSRCKKALIAESVRDSLHSWCKRVKARSKLSIATRSVCSVESTIDEIDEDMTVASGTISPSCSSSAGTLNQLDQDNDDEAEGGIMEDHNPATQHEYSFRVSEYLSQAIIINGEEEEEDIVDGIEEEEESNSSHPAYTLFELFRRT